MSRPETMARAFLSAAHRMTADQEREKSARTATLVRLITSLRDQTQSKAELEDCNKMLAVLS